MAFRSLSITARMQMMHNILLYPQTSARVWKARHPLRMAHTCSLGPISRRSSPPSSGQIPPRRMRLRIQHKLALHWLLLLCVSPRRPPSLSRVLTCEGCPGCSGRACGRRLAFASGERADGECGGEEKEGVVSVALGTHGPRRRCRRMRRVSILFCPSSPRQPEEE